MTSDRSVVVVVLLVTILSVVMVLDKKVLSCSRDSKISFGYVFRLES